ncbi:uncharacterized protein LOC129774007 [Toxorhynchites rutilus septentrionalis]|uniref:uncharacterized protein LOC129774007 n=1 Tax=Toxorhynchites rutilus septentrionalis TaxID=329112 RepID=UPI00247A5F90|nr:uncharacterized protein LOC129774007 [Toxorhynchites rutilus septentrionalis]
MSLNNNVRDEDLFEINHAGKEATCRTCGKKITDLRKFSYQRHYRLVHKQLAVELQLRQEDDIPDFQPPPTKVPKIPIRMTQHTYMWSMTELVTANGLPLNLFRYPAFQRIARPLEEGFPCKLQYDGGKDNFKGGMWNK